MVEIEAVYEGRLHCRVTHVPSGAQFTTDAPKDNQGEGASFSPTDLIATALGSCILTTMGIVALRHGIELAGAKAKVIKEMVTQPVRRIGALRVTVTFARPYADEQRALLEGAAAACPVHRSLHPDVQALVVFKYPDA